MQQRRPHTRPTRLRALALAATSTLTLSLAHCAASRPAPAPSVASRAPTATAEPAPATPPAPRDDGRLPGTATPRSYTLALTIDPAQESYRGTQRIEVNVPAATRTLVLHARTITVRSASVSAGGSTQPAAVASRPAVGGMGDPEELVLTFAQPVPAGTATLELAFDGPYDSSLRGIYRVRSGDQWYVFTQFEATDARRGFPCFDEPGFKVPWELSLTVPQGLVAAANMPESARSENASEHTSTVRFAATPNTPSYLVAFAVGPFDVVEGAREPVPIRALAPRGSGPQTRLILEAAHEHLRILGEYFGRAYPYPKLDLVAVPEFSAGAMENPGLVTFRDELMLLDAQRAPTGLRRAMALVTAHELAHQWFGDLVTMRWWNDLWLNEGFATWMENRTVDAWRPTFGARVQSLRDRGGAMALDSLPAARAVRQPVRNSSEATEAFDGITYEKGAAVIGMIERWLGEDTFRAGVREYIAANAWSNAEAGDLFARLEAASHQNVSAVASTFLDQPGVPLVTAELRCAQGSAPTIALSQQRFTVPMEGGEPLAAARWRIPVCVQYATDATHTDRACTVLENDTGTLALPENARCPQWVHPNAGESGYYRYAITDAVRPLLTAATLRGLDVATRVGLVDDMTALVSGGQLGAHEALRLLDAFRSERERIVVEAIVGVLVTLDDHVADAQTRPALRRWTADFLRPIARELGWQPRPNENDEQRMLRRLVLSAMANAEDTATLAEVERRAQSWLRDHGSVDADVAAFVVPVASRRANAQRFDALVAALAANPSPTDRGTLVRALANFEDPALQRRALEHGLTEAMRMQDLMRLVYVAASRPARRPAVMAWLRERWEPVRAKLAGDLAGRLTDLASGACSAEEIAEERTFWEPRVTSLEGAERSLRQGLQAAAQCAALRTRERPHLAEFFARPTRRGR